MLKAAPPWAFQRRSHSARYISGPRAAVTSPRSRMYSGGQPNSPSSSTTCCLAAGSLPQTKRLPWSPSWPGSIITPAFTVLSAFTTRASGKPSWICSASDVSLQMASVGAMPLEETSGLATSTRTLPARFSAPACARASSEAMPAVALNTTSPNAAASANEPSLAASPAPAAHSTALGLPASREPIITSWPARTRPVPRLRPTFPVPRTPTLMGAGTSSPARPSELGPDGLGLEVGVEVVPALLAPDARGLVAAERRRRVAAAPGVDVDRAGLEHRRQPVGLRDVAGPEPGGEPVLGVVGPRRDLLQILEGHRHENRPEDLLARDPHVVADAREEGGGDEVAAAVALRRAAGDGLGALREPGVDVALDAVELLLGDDRAEVGVRVQAGAHLGLPGEAREALDHLVEEPRLHVEPSRRVASLAGVRVAAEERAPDGGVEVGVGEDDVGALAAELERHPLQRAAALGADLAADRDRSRERHLVHVRVVDERRAGLAVAGDDVDGALGEPGLERQLAEAQRRERRLLGRLQHHRAARGQRRRDLPHRHQQRVVPGDDLRADADRLAQRVAEDVAGRDRDRLALDLGRPAGVVAQVRDRGGDVAVRGGQRFAVVERLELGELGPVALDQVGERVHEAGPLRGAELAHRPLEGGTRR